MAIVSSSALDHDEGVSLTTEIQKHLGQLLGAAYAKLPGASVALPQRLDELLRRLSSALAILADGDERTFRAELQAFMPNLQRFAMKLTKNGAQADDLVQDTLLRAWRARRRFAIGTNLGAWLFTIMRNAFYSSARKRSFEVNQDSDSPGDELAILPDQLDHLDVQDVQRALELCPVI